MSLVEALTPDPEPEPPWTTKPAPALIVGGGIIPTSLLTELVRGGAQIRPLHHLGDGPPEPGYRPSTALDEFVRLRDMTCRFPGCDHPAFTCDIDHTMPYAAGGLTHPSNLKCVCRKHHLLKTFWSGVNGWRDEQRPDGTVIWTSPTGQIYITRPGSQILFPTLCLPTGELPSAPRLDRSSDDRGVMMPKRRRTRAQDRTHRIDAERALNDAHVAERNQPPPF